jgi:hypothetical protein
MNFVSSGDGDGQVSRATTQVEDTSVATFENRAEEFGGASAPEAIELKGKEMVEEVVARGDLREHFADFAGSVRFGLDALWTSALCGGGGVSHGVCLEA